MRRGKLSTFDECDDPEECKHCLSKKCPFRVTVIKGIRISPDSKFDKKQKTDPRQDSKRVLK